MQSIIAGKIDCTKIEKARLFSGKAGQKWLDVVLIPTPNSKYDDDYVICQSVSKEEREKGIKGPILGNAKILGGKPAETKKETEAEPENDDVPF